MCNLETNSDNIEIMIYNEESEVIKDHFESLLSRWETGLETKVKDFIYFCINLLHYKFHKINMNRNGSYIDSSN